MAAAVVIGSLKITSHFENGKLLVNNRLAHDVRFSPDAPSLPRLALFRTIHHLAARRLFLRDWLCFAYSATWQLAGFPAFRRAGAFRHSCHSALFRISIFRFRVCQSVWYINHTPMSREYRQKDDFLTPLTPCPARTNETLKESLAAEGTEDTERAETGRVED